MFLDDQEILALTNKSKRVAQRRTLERMGIEFILRPDGSIVILREHVQTLLQGKKPQPKLNREKTPDWSKFNG